MDGGIGRAVLGGRTVLVLTITKPSPRVQAVSVDLDVGYTNVSIQHRTYNYI